MQEKILNQKIKSNYPIAPDTTYKIGGQAKYYFEACNSDEILACLEFSKKHNLKYFILGGGSNVLFSDKGFDGLVIKINNQDIKYEGEKVMVDAGVKLQDLVLKSAQRGLAGLEYMAGIPGSLGGAIRGNAGAYGHEIAEVVESVSVIINMQGDFKVKELKKNDMRFGYRSSIAKDKKYIIVGAVIKLKRHAPEEIKKIVKSIIKERNEKQPYEYPSAGCVFKNIENNQNEKLKEFEIYGKVPAARIIDRLGMKGKKIGGAQVSEKHANFIINTGKSTAGDIKKIIKLIKTRARDKYNIKLEEEIQIINY